MTNGDLQWESAVISAWHILSNTPERTSGDNALLSEPWAVAHEKFHDSLISACGSSWLLRLRGMLYLQSERYRRLSVPLDTGNRDVRGEHKGIYDAVIARDIPSAQKRAGMHLNKTTEILLQSQLNI